MDETMSTMSTTVEALRSESNAAADLRNDEIIAWLWEALNCDREVKARSPWYLPHRGCRHCLWKFAYVTSKLVMRRALARKYNWPYVKYGLDGEARLDRMRNEIRMFRERMRQNECVCGSPWEYPQGYDFNAAPDDALEEYMLYHYRKVDDVTVLNVPAPRASGTRSGF
jgi:hypothetical protein